MIIQHNMAALMGARNIGINTNLKAKASERLGSGYRINRAADDAAGLSISEKMRWQIRGLNKASNNAQDGISMIQTAEGALGEMHSILHRMNELATQAANDTNTDLDREAIQREITQIQADIDRISDTTEFNTIPVLRMESLVKVNGSNSPKDVSLEQKVNVTPPNGVPHDVYGATIDFSDVSSVNISDMIGKEFTTTCTANCDQVFNFKFTDADTSTVNIQGSSMYVEIGINNPNISDGTDLVNEIMQMAQSKQSEAPFNSYTSPYGDIFIGHVNGMASDGSKLHMYAVSGGPPYADGMGLLKVDKLIDVEHTLLLQTGSKEGETIPYVIRTINSQTLGVNPLSVDNNENAGKSMTAIQNAVSSVSEYRSYLGALQNRLERTILNLDNTVENTQAAESRIRDANMAKEMLDMTKYNMLEQVGTSFLAQANSSVEGVLSLLQ